MSPEGGPEGIGAPGEPATRRTPVDGRRLVELGWLAAAAAVPLAVNPWGHDPFTPVKVALLRSLVWGMVVVWALDAVRHPGGRVGWRSPITLPTAVLVAVAAAATLLGVAPQLSLWGSVTRGQGLLTLVSYAALGALVAANLKSEAPVRRLLAVVAWTAVPIVVLGALQAAGVSGGLVSDARSPVLATLGRSNFLGTYLAMVFPLTVVWTAIARRRRWRVAAGLLAVVELAVLLLTQVRAAWLAAAAGAALLLVAAHADRVRGWWRRPGVRTSVVALAVVALACGLTFARAGGSGAARLGIWQGCLRLLFERPLLGYGPDALEVAFTRVYPADLVYHQGRWAVVDRAHNWPLDLAVSLGLAGLAAFVAVVVAAVAAAWRPLWRDGPRPAHRLLLAAAAAGVAANLSANLLSFDVTETATLLWLLLGILAAAERWTAAEDDGPARAPAASSPTPVAMAVGLALICLIVVFNGRQVAADVWVRRAGQAAVAGEAERALEASRRAIAAWPREAEWFKLRAQLEAGRLRSNGTPDPAWLHRADGSLAEAVRLQPLRFDLWLLRGRLAVEAFLLGDLSAAEAAEVWFRRAAELAPQHAFVFHQWALLDRATGRLVEAEGRLRKAVDLDSTSAAAWTDLGRLQLERGRLDEAGYSFERALAVDFRWLPAWIGAATVRGRLGDEPSARQALESARRLAPDHPEVERLEGLLDSGGL